MGAKTIMVQGTSSNAGKSVLTTALCRILQQKGLKVAPFKAWNMSQNSHTTGEGLEIGVAQGVQSELLGIQARGEFNPIFLKAGPNRTLKLYVKGQLRGEPKPEDFKAFALPIIEGSLRSLMASYDVVVIEGAGSPVELNIKEREVANMSVAKLVDAPVLIVADVDRGGALAGIVGTIDLFEKAERKLVIGSVLNRFRGDLEILKPGCTIVQEYTGVPVVGVIPYSKNLIFPAEDGEGARGALGPKFDDFVEEVRSGLDLDYIFARMGVL